MKLYVALLVGPSAKESEPIFGSSNPELVNAVVERLNSVVQRNLDQMMEEKGYGLRLMDRTEDLRRDRPDAQAPPSHRQRP